MLRDCSHPSSNAPTARNHHPNQPPPPLQAAEENDLACLEALLAWGADVAAVDDQGNNVLHAVARQKAKAGVVYAGVVARLVDLAPQVRSWSEVMRGADVGHMAACFESSMLQALLHACAHAPSTQRILLPAGPMSPCSC